MDAASPSFSITSVDDETPRSPNSHMFSPTGMTPLPPSASTNGGRKTSIGRRNSVPTRLDQDSASIDGWNTTTIYEKDGENPGAARTSRPRRGSTQADQQDGYFMDEEEDDDAVVPEGPNLFNRVARWWYNG